MSNSLTSHDFALVSESTAPPAELARRLREDVSAFPFPPQWIDNLKAFGDGGQWLPLGAASGGTSDRRGGKLSPIFWNELDLRAFRVHSRWLWDTNPFMIGFGGALVGYHVRKGYGWQACLKGSKKTPYPTELTPTNPIVRKGQNILDQWRDQNLWPLKSREAFRRWRRDGDLFGRLGYGGWGNYPWFRFIEPEQVGSPSGDTNGPDSFGIAKPEHDQAGPTEAVHVWDIEDGAATGEWLPGNRVIHVKANVDSTVKRGIPDSLPLREFLPQSQTLLRNMLGTAIEQAAVAWLEGFPTATAQQVGGLIPQITGNSANPPAATSNLPYWMSDGRGSTLNKFRPGSVIRTEGNRIFNPAPYSAGVPNYIEVEQAALRAACVRWNFPEYMTAKANDVNFAAALTTGSPFSVSVEGGQMEFGLCWERPVALKVLELARDAGLLTWEEWAALDVEVTEPAIVTPEADKDAATKISLVNAKILSPQTAQLQLQLDPQHEQENIRQWASVDLDLDTLPGTTPETGPGGATAKAPPKEPSAV